MKLSIFLTIFLTIFSFNKDLYSSERKELEESSKASILKIFSLNEILHESLFNYNEANILENAKKMKEALSEIKNPTILAILSNSKNAMESMIKARSKREINEAYQFLSKDLVSLLTVYDLGESYNAYYCPMVKKDWVQNTKKNRALKNPYAPEMPHCGTQKTHY